ncbi:predicted protein [Pyrenophora tritici-repentis Pt-1C-BFP]|uniref:Uncharacterized protein n=1 Tax=Pyrenophora tritici-repentis (strain Pt-1C-BFP) TaxID=426418 RepID=B2WNJ3_PYRTR|nr:uncharacterized protein PTRG_11553 [Pyrenophora tritici-repentis Pt-1C-BFP]EDU44603.1 predicted protein [Pyrenophora tritici-repentis Pt-1C-BFP]
MHARLDLMPGLQCDVASLGVLGALQTTLLSAAAAVARLEHHVTCPAHDKRQPSRPFNLGEHCSLGLVVALLWNKTAAAAPLITSVRLAGLKTCMALDCIGLAHGPSLHQAREKYSLFAPEFQSRPSRESTVQSPESRVGGHNHYCPTTRSNCQARVNVGPTPSCRRLCKDL